MQSRISEKYTHHHLPPQAGKENGCRGSSRLKTPSAPHVNSAGVGLRKARPAGHEALQPRNRDVPSHVGASPFRGAGGTSQAPSGGEKKRLFSQSIQVSGK